MIKPGFSRSRLIEILSLQKKTQRTLLDWLRVEYGIEKPSDKQASHPGRAGFRHLGKGGPGCRSGCEERLLSPFPLSSTVEERGMRFANGLPRVALADSPTRGYFLKARRGC
jgi:hypothetical protein